jgi:hypothetical protein
MRESAAGLPSQPERPDLPVPQGATGGIGSDTRQLDQEHGFREIDRVAGKA